MRQLARGSADTIENKAALSRCAYSNWASAISAETTDDPANGLRNIIIKSVPITRKIVRSWVALILGVGIGGGSNPPGACGHSWVSRNIESP